jgi:hypothetical protein
LIEKEEITENSSLLIVVGRQDTGDFEAQIRGSQHAWDTRIISMDALFKLVDLKITSDEEDTTEKIRSVLVPFEYTRLDNIIDVIFATAKDVEEADESSKYTSSNVANDEKTYNQNPTPREIIEDVRTRSLEALSNKEGRHFLANKRTQFWTSDKSARAVCAVSKKYDRDQGYWYAFHPHNLKVVGSNPTPATNSEASYRGFSPIFRGFFIVLLKIW